MIVQVPRQFEQHSLSSGRYQNAGYQAGTQVGPDFPIRRGEAYLFSMLQGVTGVVVP
ncbi:MAG: hypothetical protein GY703_01315 [Gammaproteobacteria bacterium]|nr:hypothetical protein [Gammaproteobacteria bacterium]